MGSSQDSAALADSKVVFWRLVWNEPEGLDNSLGLLHLQLDAGLQFLRLLPGA